MEERVVADAAAGLSEAAKLLARNGGRVDRKLVGLLLEYSVVLQTAVLQCWVVLRLHCS